MSKCISNRGEYSEHFSTVGSPYCAACGEQTTPETPTPGRCQRCGDEYGPWDETWTCENCLGGDR